MGFFGGPHGWGGNKKAPLPKICYTYPAIMKLSAVTHYPKKIRKINESRDTPLISADISIIHLKSANYAISRNKEIIFWYTFSIYFNFS